MARNDGGDGRGAALDGVVEGLLKLTDAFSETRIIEVREGVVDLLMREEI